jgi:hypothetical protein
MNVGGYTSEELPSLKKQSHHVEKSLNEMDTTTTTTTTTMMTLSCDV